jgi:2-amino-4-hydroxy-6-hydroxymethyldihydropteridine diphosphokinase
MARAFIGVGSNIDPEANVQKALKELASHVRILKISTFYRTNPENRPEQPQYYNGVVEIETDFFPADLKHGILRIIEENLGRKRGEDRYSSRTIDLDLLIYDDLATKTDDLLLPDPEITERPYLIFPLLEMDPELFIPGKGKPLKDVSLGFNPDSMKPLKSYTERLRKEILDG